MDEDDHHSNDGAPHMVELDGRVLAMAAFVCSGVVQPRLANDEVVYHRLDGS